MLNVTDCKNDPRFNSNLDRKLNRKTNECLAMPLRGSMGGGAVIGVIQLVNKKGGFDHADEEALVSLVQRIAEDMHAKFRELEHVADTIYGSATFVNEKGGGLGDKISGTTHQYDQPTAASVGQRHGQLTEHEQDIVFEVNKGDVTLGLKIK